MKHVVRPIEFVWCGILYVPGRSEAYLRSEAFVGELIGKINTFSQVPDSDESFTLDVIWEGYSQTVLNETRDGVRMRACCKRKFELQHEQALLKPDTDCVGPRFLQVVVGDIEFLLAASRELYPEDGWPETLSDDIEESIGLLTTAKNILCFIRPHIPEPFLISMLESPSTPGEHEHYLQ